MCIALPAKKMASASLIVSPMHFGHSTLNLVERPSYAGTPWKTRPSFGVLGLRRSFDHNVEFVSNVHMKSPGLQRSVDLLKSMNLGIELSGRR